MATNRLEANSISKSESFARMMNADDKKIAESKNFLTQLARKIFFDMGLTTRQYYSRIDLWLRKKYGTENKENIAQISSDRNNFMKEITHDAMTVNVFQKMTQSLGASRVTITVRMEFDDGRADHESKVTFINTNVSGDVALTETEEP